MGTAPRLECLWSWATEFSELVNEALTTRQFLPTRRITHGHETPQQGDYHIYFNELQNCIMTMKNWHGNRIARLETVLPMERPA
jgi:hypothetical protein